MKNIRNNIDKILEAIIIAYGTTGVAAVILAIYITAIDPKMSNSILYVIAAFGLSFFLLIALVKTIVKSTTVNVKNIKIRLSVSLHISLTLLMTILPCF